MPHSIKQPDSSDRISFFLDEPNPTPGAPWTRINSFAKACGVKKYTVDVIGVFSPTCLEKKGIKRFGHFDIINMVFKIPLTDPLLFLFNYLVSSVTSTFVLIARRPRIAVVSFPGGDSSSGFLLACEILGIKTVVDYRDEWENQFIYSRAKSAVSRKFYTLIKKVSNFYYNKACFVSVVTKPFVTALSESGVRNVILVPNGASCSSFKPVDKKPDSEFFTIVYSGGVGEYYRLDVVIAAMKKLADRGLHNIRLLMVGRGTNASVLNRILSYARELGLQNAVTYLGNKSDVQELNKILAEANAGIIPFDDNPLWRNALTAKFFEYCACGLPVVATVFNDSILANVIRENKIGLTSNPLDVNGLADAIEKLSTDKEFMENAGKRARVVIEQQFNRDKISEEFINRVCKAANC